MGIVEKVIGFTPFYKKYIESRKKKIRAQQIEAERLLLPKRVKFYSQFIQPGDLVFDVGANIGNRINAFLKCNAKVVAIEPQTDCASMLQEIFGGSIVIEQIGLSDQPGELEMYLSTDSTISSFSKDFINNTKERFKHSEWTDTVKVPISTMDLMIAKHGLPQFCKIDVEGFELQVLNGLNHRIPYISFEYCVPEMSDNMLACLARLNEISPGGTFNYSIGESMDLALNAWRDFESFKILVKSKEFTDTLFGDIYFKS